MDSVTAAAFERLLNIAQSNTHQARRAAGFILAWWNAESLGGFDLADLFAVDGAIAEDMATVFAWLSRQQSAHYPAEHRAGIEKVIAQWRPDVWERSQQEPALRRRRHPLLQRVFRL